ncbi:MAG: 3-phosphoshikimate 1-carboxyvinyltransferase [Desulfovibrio sp.]|nr:3-phosphoshikimate 1-carboxyvinyltransferase [Desulfovibrio sp.]
MENNIVKITAPPSKSLSHRFLIGAALARGESVVRHTLESVDLEATRDVLSAAGAKFEPLREEGEIAGWRVTGVNGHPRGGSESDPLQCNVQESGTTCRLLTAVLAAGEGMFHIYGEGRMHDRPIGDLCHVLQMLGADIKFEEKRDCPPILLRANGIDPGLVDGYVRLGMDESSQFFSGLLMAAPLASSSLSIEVGGKKALSWPYVGLTLQTLSAFGIRFVAQARPRIGAPWNDLQKSSWRIIEDIRPGCFRVRVWPSSYKAGAYFVEGDWSGASYFLAAGALGKKPVTVRGLNPESMQGDRILLEILRKMGASVEISPDSVTVYPSELHGVSLDMGACPDLVPTVAALAAYAKGSTRISNVGHLRIKESDRIEAPARELSKAGVMVDALSEGLLINGMGGLRGHVRNKPDRPCRPADGCFSAHNDHRMAMSLALLEMGDTGIDVRECLDDPSVVKKSFPNFWELWSSLK